MTAGNSLNTPLTTTAPRRPWWRLYPFTWCVLLLTTGVLVVLIVRGERLEVEPNQNPRGTFVWPVPSPNWPPPQYEETRYEHGWPWTHTTRVHRQQLPPITSRAILAAYVSDRGPRDAWKLTQDITSFDRWAFLGNLAAALFVLFVAAVASQAWVRTRGRWWQFRIRELLALTALVACALGWWRMNMLEVRGEDELLNRWPKAVGTREYMGPLWLRRLAGADRLRWLYRVRTLTCNLCPTADTSMSDAEAVQEADSLRELSKSLRYLQRVNSHDTGLVDDPRLIIFPPHANLLCIPHRNGMTCVYHLTDLRHVQFDDAADFDLFWVHRLEQLETLYLSGKEITDDGMQHLVGLKTLQQLTLEGTSVTHAGLAELKSALPNLQVTQVDEAP